MNSCDITLTDFVDLPKNELLMILKWRNDPSITNWMYTSNQITEEEHFNFINNLTLDNTKKYFLVTVALNRIGAIYFIDIDFAKKTSFFGLYANPFEKMQDSGKMLLESVMKYAFEILKLDTLKLEVFSDNEKALNLYKKYAFKQSGVKTVNDKDVICMELMKDMIK